MLSLVGCANDTSKPIEIATPIEPTFLTEPMQETVPHEHSYVAVTTEATCSNKGQTTHTCECGDTYIDNEVEMLPHDYDVAVTEVTCSTNGITTSTCKVCGYIEFSNEINAIGHSYKSEITNPTCTKKGYTIYTCSVCGKSYKDNETKALDHKYESKTVAPTGKTEGYDIHTCSVCGDSYKDNYTAPVVVWTEVNETVYAKAEVNIRKGPDISHEKIGTLKKGDSVKRIAKGNNDWSKIEYNGEIVYVSANYLTTDNPKSSNIADEMKQRKGMIGRLTIPDVGISVALFYSPVTKNSQSIVDRKDSAVYLDCINFGQAQDLIADHVHQGFSAIKKVVPNKTIAKIDYGTHIIKFKCVDKFIGKNIHYDLVDNNGKSVLTQNKGGVAMYTCNSDGMVTITYWQKVS